ncbi:MAG TPA: GTPase Era, partial [Anaerolineales bacterium]
MTDFRSGYVAIVGRPNVGKSTLVNALLGQKIAAVSHKPQTTRRRQLGILTTPSAQLILVDTPGIHNARHKLGEFLNQEAEAALKDVDVILFLVDASEQPSEEDVQIAELLKHSPRRAARFLVLNKIDLLTADALEAQVASHALLLDGAPVLKVSAARGTGLEDLIGALTQALPSRAAEYPEDQVTDSFERDIAADLIREAALLKLREEVPHGIAVRIDEFTERENGMAYIAATLFVERDSQKGIVIGEGGKML